MSVVATKESIVKLLETRDLAVAKALVVLNDRQTADEQSQEDTKYLNGKGFRPCHARMGTSMAKFYLRFGYLTPKQIAYWRKKMKCGNMRIGIYAGQLLEVAKIKEQAKQTLNSDIGNLCEELLVLEEQYANYQDSDDFDTLAILSTKINNIKTKIKEIEHA